MPSLLLFKEITAFTLWLISVCTAFASLRFLSRHQKFLAVGDAVASGIFIGAALFHLFPSVIHNFIILQYPLAVMKGSLLVFLFLLLFLIVNKLILKHSAKMTLTKTSGIAHVNASLLIITLFIHALSTGLALGLADSTALFSIILIAILAHKIFEMFAFVVNLHRYLHHSVLLILIIVLFSLATPTGILSGAFSRVYFTHTTDILMDAYFNAFACATFLYIGIFHSNQQEYTVDHNYYSLGNKIITTLIGIVGMAIIGIWA